MLGIFLDLETNGLDIHRHRVIEIALRIIDLETGKVRDSYDTVVMQPQDIWEQHDPESLKINGFTWDRVKTGQSESVVCEDILALFAKHKIRRGGSVFICQNPSFDRAFLSQIIDIYRQEEQRWPYHWLDLASMHWALAIRHSLDTTGKQPKNITLSKDSIAKELELPPEAKPHRAMNGVDHLILCYQKLLG